MADFLGFLTTFLLLVLIINVIIRKMVRKYKFKLNPLLSINSKISKYHKLLALAVLILGTVHGYLIVGLRLVPHTGSILLLSVLIMFLLFISGKYGHYKSWFIKHKIFYYVVLVALFLHIFFKNIIS